MKKRIIDKVGACPDASRVILAAKGTSFLELVGATMLDAAAGKLSGPTSLYTTDLHRQQMLLEYEGGSLVACAKDCIEKTAALGGLHTKLFELRIPNRHALGTVMAGPLEIRRDQTKDAASAAALAHMAIWALVSNASMARPTFAALLSKQLGPGCHVYFVADERQPDLSVFVYLSWLQAVL